MYQRENNLPCYDKDAAEHEKDYLSQNIVRSRFGDPPPNWYPGSKHCPFHGGKCFTSHCMAWYEESPEAGGFCSIIGRLSNSATD